MTEQSIQLGGTTIIPKYSIPSEITVLCITGLSGIISGDIDIGRTSGSNEYFNTQIIDDTNEIQKTVIGNLAVGTEYSIATSVFFSLTPDANWNTITSGKWKIFICYIDNSNL